MFALPSLQQPQPPPRPFLLLQNYFSSKIAGTLCSRVGIGTWRSPCSFHPLAVRRQIISKPGGLLCGATSAQINNPFCHSYLWKGQITTCSMIGLLHHTIRRMLCNQIQKSCKDQHLGGGKLHWWLLLIWVPILRIS